MGLLVRGEWVDRWYDTEGHEGHFVRSAAKFRNWITAAPDPAAREALKPKPDVIIYMFHWPAPGPIAR